jgi:hypothetical protein
MPAEWKGTTPAEYLAFKTQQRAEQIDGMLSPFVEQRATLTSRQTFIGSELERLRDLQAAGDTSDSVTDQIAALEREWDTSRQVEVRLNEQEGIAKKAVVSINRQPLT